MVNYAHFRRVYERANPRERKRLLKKAPKKFIHTFVRAAQCLLSGKIHLTPSTYSRIYKKRALIRKLAACKGRQGVCKARNTLIQHGGFLPILLAAAPFIGKALLGLGASVAASAAGSAIRKAINK